MRLSHPAVAATAAAGLVGSVLVGSAGIAVAADSRKAVALPEQRAAAPLPEGLAAASLVGSSTVRYSGADRYETAAEVSRHTWDYATTSVVYLVSGESFPDALSTGASTLAAGPVLLTTRDDLPPATEAELARLRPCAVVVVGGENAVSDAVALRADSYTEPETCATF